MNRNTIRTLTIAGLLIASAAAQAEILGSKPNQADGEIFWTSSRCGSENDGWQVFSTDDGGVVVLHGCAYGAGDDRVAIEWSNGRLSIMPDLWHLTTAGKRLTGVPANPAPRMTAKSVKYRM
jgi:hypothetical protein